MAREIDSDSLEKDSLNSIYGSRIGYIQSLSLLLNAGLMVYAHVGLSAVIVANQERIQDSQQGSGGNSVCKERDFEKWLSGGAQNKSDDTQFCSIDFVNPETGRTGCLLNTKCQEECFNNAIGYSDTCATCFAAVPRCNFDTGCSLECSVDRTSATCLSCNAPCDDAFYNCTGFERLQKCNRADQNKWLLGGGAQTKSNDTNFCSREYANPVTGRVGGCLLNQDCHEQCFVDAIGYSEPCATCFAEVPICTSLNDCDFLCADDPMAAECLECLAPCDEAFYNCTGLQLVDSSGSMLNSNTGSVSSTIARSSTGSDSNEAVCQRQQQGVDLEEVKEYFVVYEIMFFRAVHTAWTSDARLLAVIVVVFSGAWPYIKNLILMLAWYLPLTNKRRSWVLKWLRRLGKYTLVDIYVVIVLMVGVQTQMMVAGDVPLVVKAEPRGAIIAFLIATIHEFVQIEWMTHCHQVHLPRKVSRQQRGGEGSDTVWKALRFENGFMSNNSPYVCSSSWLPRLGFMLLLMVSMGLLVTGSILESIRFTATVGGDAEGCEKTYNVYSLATALISDFSFHKNSAKPGTWILFISYWILVVGLPVLAHLIQLSVLLLNVKSKFLCQLADISSTFASIEVLILGLFVVQYKFAELIGALAGNDNGEFFGISADLGIAFWILIGYSVISGLLQYFFSAAVSQFYELDPHQTIDYVWIYVFSCGCLEQLPTENTPSKSSSIDGKEDPPL